MFSKPAVIRARRWVVLIITAALISGCAGVAEEQARSPDFLQRSSVDEFQLRVMSWNTKLGSLASGGPRHESFQRIIRAIEPDVICLQEGGTAIVAELGRMMRASLPLGNGRKWQIHAPAHNDNIIISRFPLRLKAADLVVPEPYPDVPGFKFGQAFALVEIPDHLGGRDFYIAAVHNRSRDGEERMRQRQQQSDSLIRWLRRLEQENVLLTGTPVIIMGDLNVLAGDPAQHLTTLLTGDIVDEERYGPDIMPDWDHSSLAQARPSHNAQGEEYYSWRFDDYPFPPGELSRILYTDSVLHLQHSFILNTTIMTPEALRLAGLQAGDVLWQGEPGNYDHLPLVVDFTLKRNEIQTP
jgi:endonuclease/exonuclease/phosphatase family metal-dependent hydrolase